MEYQINVMGAQVENRIADMGCDHVTARNLPSGCTASVTRFPDRVVFSLVSDEGVVFDFTLGQTGMGTREVDHG